MARTFETLAELLGHDYDSVIDVRSPAEFEEDRVPGAINMPVLSNEERAEVGTIYVQQSPFLARKIGAAMVFRNAARHVEGPLRGKEGGWRPLVYCWRGGQRSGSFSYLLKEIGWRSETIAGGYQSYRRLVHKALYDEALEQRVILLDGYTGTAKTDLLPRLSERGVQVIDLEGLANHRGSLLGARAGGQPSQKAFESALAGELSRLDPARPLVVEAESNKVGERLIPPALWAAMKRADRVEITAPLAARAAYLVEAYADVWSEPEELEARFAPLARLRGHEAVETWRRQLKAGEVKALARSLMETHYDPAYAKSREAIGVRTSARVEAERLDAAGLDHAADRLAREIERLSAG
ncbi:tRNA 2-selenouridine(34) synthase MnmH [Histidinibacterium aquaticum]|uniref:tRNA 2-selenouridine(34) synthase MnmH n=1 Tax=Histidinibacterium aquaticum TaxID=2613962 RepID=A0A5J5GFY1_9RHOB|nr:tRNA 2-selenouridine(34) synthase MnmH [Histidinibacterium aquaticum]KAA9006997.1 tRNA 2-selenouridine(34) synthase MnmH [Histidinibacterium aquaticum]